MYSQTGASIAAANSGFFFFFLFLFFVCVSIAISNVVIMVKALGKCQMSVRSSCYSSWLLHQRQRCYHKILFMKLASVLMMVFL